MACRGSFSYVRRDYDCVCAGIVSTLALVIPAFYRVEPLAGLLLLPYLAWATFALFLNSTLINLNPQVCLSVSRSCLLMLQLHVAGQCIACYSAPAATLAVWALPCLLTQGTESSIGCNSTCACWREWPRRNI